MMKLKENNILKALIFSAILLGLVILAPTTLALFGGGFDDPNVREQFQFYEIVAISSLVAIWILFLIETIIKKGDDKYGNNTGFMSIGEKPAFGFFKRFTTFQLLLLSLILFFIVGLLNVTFIGSQTTYTGIGLLEKAQFTEGQNVSYNSLLIPISENLLAGFVIMLSFLGLRSLARKFKMNPLLFMILALLLIPLIIGGFGVLWHSTVYASSEIALEKVFVFWTIGGVLTVSSGVFVIFWMMHLINNLFYDLSIIFSSDFVVLYSLLTMGILIGLYVVLYRGRLFGVKKENQIPKPEIY